MERSKVLAIITGAISIALALAYLAVVQFLDMRGEMIPAPIHRNVALVINTKRGGVLALLPFCDQTLDLAETHGCLPDKSQSQEEYRNNWQYVHQGIEKGVGFRQFGQEDCRFHNLYPEFL
jgi:hypothetical protein